MLLRAIGAMLPAAFAKSWTAGLTAVTAAVLLLANGVEDRESTSASIMD